MKLTSWQWITQGIKFNRTQFSTLIVLEAILNSTKKMQIWNLMPISQWSQVWLELKITRVFKAHGLLKHHNITKQWLLEIIKTYLRCTLK